MTIPAESLLPQKDKTESMIRHLKEFADSLRKKVEICGEEIVKSSSEKNAAYVTGLKEACMNDLRKVQYILNFVAGVRTAISDIPLAPTEAELWGTSFAREETAKDAQKK